MPAGIADDDVEAAERRDGVGDALLAEGLLAEVARERHALAAGVLDQLDHVAGGWLFARKIVDRHVGAFARIGDGRGAAHAGIAAGDQRLAPSEPSRAFVARLAMVRWRLHVLCEARPRLLLLGERRLRVFVDWILQRCGHGLSVLR